MVTWIRDCGGEMGGRVRAGVERAVRGLPGGNGRRRRWFDEARSAVVDRDEGGLRA